MLLDAVIDYMPAPIDIPPIKGVFLVLKKKTTRPSSDEEPSLHWHSKSWLTLMLVN